MMSLDTRPSLLIRIRDSQDVVAWSEFVHLYAPLLHSYGLRNGLQDADAADMAQETLRKIARNAGAFEYDPEKGSFRGWLLVIARNELRRIARSRPRQPVGSGDSAIHKLLSEVPAPCDDRKTWDREYESHVFHWVARKIRKEFRERTWQAFWRTVVDGEPVGVVATSLGMSLGALYIARSRVTLRIRSVVADIEGN